MANSPVVVVVWLTACIPAGASMRPSGGKSSTLQCVSLQVRGWNLDSGRAGRVTLPATITRELAMLFDFVDIKNENVYKLLTSTVGPRPIAWVTTQDTDGTVNAAPFSFFNAMSGNPPVLAFGIGGRGPGDVKDTGGNIRRTGQFVINLVSFELAEPMNVTAIDFPRASTNSRKPA